MFLQAAKLRRHGRYTKRYIPWRIHVNGIDTYIHGTTRPLGDLLTMVVKKPRIQVLGWSSKYSTRYENTSHGSPGFIEIQPSRRDIQPSRRDIVLLNLKLKIEFPEKFTWKLNSTPQKIGGTALPIDVLSYCWRKRSCTTWLVWNPVNNVIFTMVQLVQDFFHQQYIICCFFF